MPRYYFHLRDGDRTVDLEGQELADLDSARLVAIESARDLICASVRQGDLDLSPYIDIEDPDQQLVLTVSFAEAITVRR